MNRTLGFAALVALLLVACGTAPAATMPPPPRVQTFGDVTRAEWEARSEAEQLNAVRFAMSGMTGCRVTPEQVVEATRRAYREQPALADPPVRIVGTLALQGGCVVRG